MTRRADANPAGWDPRRIAIVALWAVVGGMVGLFLLSESRSAIGAREYEGLAHVLAAGVLTVAISSAINTLRGRPSLLTMLLWATAATLVLEAAQLARPDRSVELNDVLAGLAGVLMASIVMELVFRSVQPQTMQAIQVYGAALAALALLLVFFFGPEQQSVALSRPDGDRCPLTMVSGSSERITIGRNPPLVDGCLITESGGLGLLSSLDRDALVGDDAVLVTSLLRDLADNIVLNERLTIRTEISVDQLAGHRTGVVLSITAGNTGQLVRIGTLANQVEVAGPRMYNLGRRRPTISAHGIEAQSSHVVTVDLDRTSMTVSLDDVEVGWVKIDPIWLDIAGARNLDLLIGNDLGRASALHGTIEWIEIDT